MLADSPSPLPPPQPPLSRSKRSLLPSFSNVAASAEVYAIAEEVSTMENEDRRWYVRLAAAKLSISLSLICNNSNQNRIAETPKGPRVGRGNSAATTGDGDLPEHVLLGLQLTIPVSEYSRYVSTLYKAHQGRNIFRYLTAHF